MPDLREKYQARVELLQQAADRLEAGLLEHFRARRHVDRISVRVKDVDSFVEKATLRKVDPPYEEPLVEVEDQVAGRIIVFFTSDLGPTVEHLTKLLNQVEHDHKRPTQWNEFDYESVHGVFALPPVFLPPGWSEEADMPQTFELQVRTLFQHAYAEPQHDLGYKPGAPPSDEIRRELAWVAASSWGADQALERARLGIAETSKTD